MGESVTDGVSQLAQFLLTCFHLHRRPQTRHYRKMMLHDGIFGQNLVHPMHPTRICTKLPVQHTYHESDCPSCAMSLLAMALVKETCGHHHLINPHVAVVLWTVVAA